MGGEWTEATVGDAFDLVNGYAFKSADFRDQGVPVIKIKNVKAGEFSEHDFSYVSEDFLKNRSNKLACFGDLLISMSGNRHDGSPETWVGKVAQFRKTNDHFINQRVGALRIKKGVQMDSRFASYLLSSMPYQELFIAIATSSGGQANLSPAQILGAPMRYPSLPEQRAIAHILGTLDDKIELNRRRNQTLEAMARALYKDWFVDFGPVRAKMEGREPYLPAEIWQLFPDRLDDDGKPEGWEIQSLDQIAALVTNSIAPGKTPEAVFEHYSIPAFDVGRMPALEVGESIKSNKYIVDPDSVLVSKLNPQTPRVWLPAVATDRAICSTEFMQFIPHDRENRSYLYCLMSSGTMQEVILQHVTGSTGSRQRAQPSQIAKVNILTPSPSVVMAFNRQAGPILKAVGENQRESQTLAQLRDTLLPKLISGELRIKDTEKFMESVA